MRIALGSGITDQEAKEKITIVSVFRFCPPIRRRGIFALCWMGRRPVSFLTQPIPMPTTLTRIKALYLNLKSKEAK